jgi:tRNA threonylcarbamoyladenosine biosynthesis protein TsaE
VLFEVATLDDLQKPVGFALECMNRYRLFAFYGEMGVGKTTMIGRILRALGVRDEVSSPTFSIVNEYLGNKGEKVYHFDFYRIESEEEAYDIGYEDYFYSGNLCFIEWPERIESLLPDDTVIVRMEAVNDIRKVEFVLPV